MTSHRKNETMTKHGQAAGRGGNQLMAPGVAIISFDPDKKQAFLPIKEKGDKRFKLVPINSPEAIKVLTGPDLKRCLVAQTGDYSIDLFFMARGVDGIWIAFNEYKKTVLGRGDDLTYEKMEEALEKL